MSQTGENLVRLDGKLLISLIIPGSGGALAHDNGLNGACPLWGGRIEQRKDGRREDRNGLRGRGTIIDLPTTLTR
jgi:hypothetical protein